ncbi:hypothetical protein [Pseudobacteroides cellulosolvens]|uniref:hypothetical protein n=1 Tax=Pseudobacteroides cellulosolvens TaxID=35825 RepID=UPI000569FB61|nr:hypothetical protein [Pseudobacteroides cellulosolvens]
MFLVLSLLTGCSFNNDTINLKYGTYVLEHTGTNTGVVPSVTISDENISFSFDALSSYLSIGTYTIKNDILTMITHDGRYKYVFQVDGDKLLFKENESSAVNLTDDRFGINITDKAEFKLKEN